MHRQSYRLRSLYKFWRTLIFPINCKRTAPNTIIVQSLKRLQNTILLDKSCSSLQLTSRQPEIRNCLHCLSQCPPPARTRKTLESTRYELKYLLTWASNSSAYRYKTFKVHWSFILVNRLIITHCSWILVY